MVERAPGPDPSFGPAIWTLKGLCLAPKRGEFDQPRRFYTSVDTAPADGGFAPRLDGRIPRTPAGAPLVLPTSALAGLVAGEWGDQRDYIVFAQMPATRLAHSVLDGMPAARDALADSIVRYAGSDLLCYRAEAPASLVARQANAWDPLLAWALANVRLDFVQTSGVLHRAQPPATLARVSELSRAQGDFELAGAAFAASLFGSAILALALGRGRIDGAAAHVTARVDEAFQEERWGVDDEAAIRTAGLLRDALMLERWFAALDRA